MEGRLTDDGARKLLQRWVDALNARDFDAMGQLLTPDFVDDYPQSGERIRGLANLRGMFENYPGGLSSGSTDSLRAVGSDPEYVLTPTFMLVRVGGSGDVQTHIVRVRYPDGSRWYVIGFVKVRDGRMARRWTYFAPEFEAPEWRRRWVEQIPEADRDHGP